MKTMTIQEFTSSETLRLSEFRTYWYSEVYPTLDDEDKAFWDYSANLWDWAEMYDDWRDSR